MNSRPPGRQEHDISLPTTREGGQAGLSILLPHALLSPIARARAARGLGLEGRQLVPLAVRIGYLQAKGKKKKEKKRKEKKYPCHRGPRSGSNHSSVAVAFCLNDQK